MKQLVNFRLSQQAIFVLSMLEQNLQINKTAVIEKLLKNYADQQLVVENPLFKYAGSIDEKTAQSMLYHIKASKYNKD